MRDIGSYVVTTIGRGPDIDLKPDLVIYEWVESRMQFASISGSIKVRAEWSNERLEYELTSVELANSSGISSDDFRLLSRPMLIHAALAHSVRARHGTGKDGRLFPLAWNDEMLQNMAANGPTDENLKWVSRFYAEKRAEGEPANRLLIEALGLPASTVNRWIRAARAKGLLD